MRVQNATIEQICEALRLVNEDYNGNLTWASEPCHTGKTARSSVAFRIAAIDCRCRGGRRGFSRNKDGQRRRIGGCACWHAHGHLFEALFSIAPRAVIVSRGGRRRITGPTSLEGNWQDVNVGSAFDPAMFSELCDC